MYIQTDYRASNNKTRTKQNEEDVSLEFCENRTCIGSKPLIFNTKALTKL